MDIKERLQKAQDDIQNLNTRLVNLEQEKQDILQEMLRTDGAIRVLKELDKEE